MMSSHLILLSILLWTGCGTYEPSDWIFQIADRNHQGTYIDPRFKPVLSEFQREARFYNVDLPLMSNLKRLEFINTNEQLSSRVGVCHSYTVGGSTEYTQISISHKYRDKVDTLKFKWIVFHELGHCVLQREHDETLPVKLMHPLLPYEAYIEKNWSKILDNFFVGTPLE